MILDGTNLTIEKLVKIAREGEEVSLSPEAEQRIVECRKMLERKLEAREVMYGVNTGIGEFSETLLTDEEASQFQKYLVYNHAAGIGDPAPQEYVRAAMASRINVHCHGMSAMRLEITKLMVDMLNRGVVPFVCQKGSVGASGDLAPMSQIALVMMGEAQAWYKGELLPGVEALRRAGLEPIVLKPRDGLAIINGSNLLNAMNALHLYDMNRWIKQAEIAAAMTLEALNANMKPYDVRLHEVRGFPGAVRTARALNRCIKGSAVLEPRKKRVQDAYSMRSTPQVLGAAHDALAWARSQVEIELNGVGDNPIFLPDENRVLTGANFQGSPVSLPMDMMSVAITMVSVMSERRLNRLMNPALSEGLPPFLAEKPGLYSGHMLSQYTACSLIVEQRMLSAPASCASIPAAADQEDFVSMGMNTSIKNEQILKNAHGVLGIEFIAAADGLDHRAQKMGEGSRVAHDVIRKYVSYLGEDRPLFPDHTVMAKVVESCEILEAVEAAIGPLE
ncbi:histidine ammonia-lyase [Candidatus Fermentibacterales bacterium]|nr:histidine ammonia-lyase [Candidatus Fermentibacterales bacterium]